MAIKIGSTHVVQLAQQFAQNAMNAGALQQKCHSFFKTMEIDSLKDALPDSVCDLFEDILEQKQQSESMMNSLKTLDEVAAPILKKQAELIRDSIETAENLTIDIRDRVFDAQCDRISRQFEKALETLKVCRNHPTQENFKAANLEISDLVQRTTNIRSLAQHCSIEYRKMDVERFNDFDFDAQRLEQLITAYRPGTFGNLCARLKSACQNDEIPIDLKAELTEAFERSLKEEGFPIEFLNLVDVKIFELAPEPKGGEHWGKLHRYDDLNRFKQAFYTALAEDFEKNLKSSQIFKNDLPEFYATFLQEAFGPTDVDARTWVQGEFPCLMDIVDSVIKKFLGNCNEHFFPKILF
jgi:hypothetical protein